MGLWTFLGPISVYLPPFYHPQAPSSPYSWCGWAGCASYYPFSLLQEQRWQRHQRLGYLRQKWEVGNHRPRKQAHSSSPFVGLWPCHVWGGGGPTWNPSHSAQRLMCTCKERLPDVAQLLGDFPSCYLEPQAGCALPQMFLAPEGMASMPHPLPGS